MTAFLSGHRCSADMPSTSHGCLTYEVYVTYGISEIPGAKCDLPEALGGNPRTGMGIEGASGMNRRIGGRDPSVSTCSIDHVRSCIAKSSGLHSLCNRRCCFPDSFQLDRV
jgi:hypothetical protein